MSVLLHIRISHTRHAYLPWGEEGGRGAHYRRAASHSCWHRGVGGGDVKP